VSRRSVSRSNIAKCSISSISGSGGRQRITCIAPSGCTVSATTPTTTTAAVVAARKSILCGRRSLSSSSVREEIEESINKSPSKKSSNTSADSSSTAEKTTSKSSHVLPSASVTPRKVGVSKEDEHKEETKRRRLSEVRYFARR
jgi:hypothetical protein